MPKITKILVANRGEIALRVMRTARELGLQTVAIYSPQDAQAPHVRFADEAYLLDGDSAADNYLNIERIVATCQESGADAVHPGYGFLSERADFVEALSAANITFIGPPAEAIKVLGDKVASKEAARRAGVPVVPGLDQFVETYEEAKVAADAAGYPVIIKAAFGGGGMGMQVVETEDNLEDALGQTQRQAKAAFGRHEVFIEKFIGRPRHIEIQLMADTHGNAVHFGERECSIQRRHQKLIEEAPSPVVTPEERARVGAAVCKLAKEVGYSNAGTAEFLYEDGEFYFNEVNTRLQVEHPVTEQVYGVDLVREQIRVAMGEELGYDQAWVDDRQRGWAIECRINAEDPKQQFMPTPGLVKRHAPPQGNGVRTDTYLYAGFDVPRIYDSMVAKLITYGKDRDEAIRKMRRALAEYELGDLVTNRGLHQLLMEDAPFCEGDMTTKYLDEHRVLERLLGIEEDAGKDAKRRLAALAAALAQEPGGIDSLVAQSYVFVQNKADNVGVDEHGRRKLTNWGSKGRREATGGVELMRYEFRVDGRSHHVTQEEHAEGPRYVVDGDAFTPTVVKTDKGTYEVAIDGQSYEFRVDDLTVFEGLHALDLDVRRARPALVRAGGASRRADGRVKPPMPGKIVEVNVAVGDVVAAGDVLVVLEAMKMQNDIKSPTAGTVTKVGVKPNQNVEATTVLVEVTPESAE